MEARSIGVMLANSCKQWGSKTALIVPDGHSHRKITYTELYVRVRQYAGALNSLGLQKGDKICIWSDNSLQWMLTDWAALSLGITTVPIYPSLPVDQGSYIAKDCGAKALFYGSDAIKVKANRLDFLKCAPLVGEGSLDELAGREGDKLSLEAWEKLIEAVEPEDLATIIYTSGTTGLPKGAMLPHRCFTTLCQSILESIPITHEDTLLGFLPLSHVFARFVDHILPISLGGTGAQAKSLMSLPADMMSIKPTIMACVPRFLENFVDKIEEGLAKQPPFKQKLFALAKSQNLKSHKGQFAPLAKFLDHKAFDGIRARTGGRMRFFVSGGAALPNHVEEMFAALGMTILQGYGLTETTAGSTFNIPEDNKPWTAGIPIKGVEVTIAADGEILIRGKTVMTGYYNLPKETAEAIDADGWFHTGDVGVFEGKHLKITDRKKDLLVLANGKNVAPQMVENRLKESALIGEAVVLGDGMESCIALIIPTDKIHAKIGTEPGAKLADNDAARKAIRAEIDAVNKTLSNFEQVKRFAILDATFSVDTGELTPSLKVKRKVVQEKYADVIRTLSR